MPRPTGRGYALLAVAAATYLAGRVLGTWELYLFAFAFLGVLVLCWLILAVSRGKLELTRALSAEHPMDGDEPDLVTTAKNRSLLPSPQTTLRNQLAGLSGGLAELELESLPPRSTKCLRVPAGRVNRGVHVLPPAEMIAEDPLGLCRAVRKVGEKLTVTVLPRLVFLNSCALGPEYGLKHDWSGRRGLPTWGAAEFRGVRPHQPGEPLSRIDWKSTAKTGVLMLREMEEPAGADLTVLLDGTAAQVQGLFPDTNYELAVRAAGSLADFALRSGRGVTLFCHEKDARQVRLSPDGNGRRALLYALAEAQADAPSPLVHGLQRLCREARHLLQAQSVIVVAISLDHSLARFLLELRKEGVHLALLYVVGASFAAPLAGTDPLGSSTSQADQRQASRGRARDKQVSTLLPFLPPREGVNRERDGTSAEKNLPADIRALLLTLSSAGIPCLTLARGEDLGERLVPEGRGRQARRQAG